MSAALRSAIAGLLAIAALVGDWVWSELYLRDDTAVHVLGALTLNLLVLALAYRVLRRALAERASTAAARVVVLLVAGLVVLTNVRLALGSPTFGPWLRAAVGVAIVSGSVAIVAFASESTLERLMRAIGFAALAFVLTPVAWHAASRHDLVWLRGTDSAVPPASRATVFLLLDELGYAAAEPISGALRDAGLQVVERPLAAAGINTTNVIPTMFAGQAIAHARPCGRSTVCSGSTFVDFSRIRVERGDVDVTGLLHPYCDIQGLRSCFPLTQQHAFGNAYRGLLAFYVQRVWPPLAERLRVPEPAGLVRSYLQQQRRFIDASRIWTDGGVLYAHLFLPHPPGLDGPTTLDADYAANVATAAALVHDIAARLRARFGEGLVLIITSDHALRETWCPSPGYPTSACALRPAFRDQRVPLIVAAPVALPEPSISSNGQVFSVLDNELQRAAARTDTVRPTTQSPP